MKIRPIRFTDEQISRIEKECALDVNLDFSKLVRSAVDQYLKRVEAQHDGNTESESGERKQW